MEKTTCFARICRIRAPNRPAATGSEPDQDIPVSIEFRRGPRRHHAGRIVVLDDQRTVGLTGEIRPAQDRRQLPASLRTEVDLPRRRCRAFGTHVVQRLGHQRALGQAQRDHLDVDHLDRDRRRGAVTVGPFVLLREGFLQYRHIGRIQRGIRRRYGQFVRLSLVVHVGELADADALRREALGLELGAAVGDQPVPGGVDIRHALGRQHAPEGARVVVLDVGIKQSERREQTGRRRHHHQLHAERLREIRAEQRSVAAESEQREAAHVAAALDRHRTDRPHHVRAGNLEGGIGRMLR